MNYHPEDFIALSSAVLDDGGTLLEDECVGKTVKLRFKDGPEGRPVWKRYETAGCGQSARLEIPYDPYEAVLILDPDDIGVVIVSDAPARPETDIKHVATVCAVDDACGLWPRYKDVVSSRSKLR